MAYGEYEPVLDAEGNAVILGKGSFGKVYLVRKAKLGRRYALKLLGHDGTGKSGSAQSRFHREVSTFADLRHTHIVSIADYGECGEGIYYVMDFCEGGSLETLVRNLRPFSVPLTLQLLDKAAAALEYAHGKGLIHRDIKPENLMLLSHPERDDDLPDLIRLIDFGLAKDLTTDPGVENVSLTLESQVLGTPLYMSPEQLAGSNVDHRADIFSLGITAWYLLAGPQAFSHLNNGTLIRQDRFSPIPYGSKLPDRLTGKARHVIARMIEKDGARRYQDYRTLREDLRAALQEENQALLAPSDYRLPAAAPPLPPPGHEMRYTALTPLGRDPATGGALWSALCGGKTVQVVTASSALAPALSQLLGRLDVPERPAALVAYERASFSPHHPDFPGSCLCTTRPPAGPDLLTILRNRPRTTLEEAKGLLQQIAEAMDFARPREIALRFSPGDIILHGLPSAPDTPAFAAAEVRLFPALPGSGGLDSEAPAINPGATLVQHSSSPGAGVPTHRDFAALIYRVLAGREIDPGALHSARNYKGIGSLQAKTDAIIRDLISGTYPAQSCRALLLALCSSESIRLPERPLLPPAALPPAPAPSQPPPAAAPPDVPPAGPSPATATVVTGSLIQDDLLVEPPLWRNLPNAARRQLVSCLRDTWDLRGDIDKDHSQATCYSSQSQTQIQNNRYALKEAEEAARDIESCRRTLQDCYFKATQAILQIRDSTDPALAEIRKKDVYGLLEIAEQARRDADLHFELLARLGPQREALLHEAEEIGLAAKALASAAGQPLPEVPIILLDGTTRSQCEEVERETAGIRETAATVMPLAEATEADSIFAIEAILATSRATLNQATARWERIRSSVAHLTGKLRQLKQSYRTLDQDREELLTQIRNFQQAVRFSVDSAARFDRDVSAEISRLAATQPQLATAPEAAQVRRFAQQAAAAGRRLEELTAEAAGVTTPEELEKLEASAQAARDSAAEALSEAGAAQRAFNRLAKTPPPEETPPPPQSIPETAPPGETPPVQIIPLPAPVPTPVPLPQIPAPEGKRTGGGKRTVAAAFLIAALGGGAGLVWHNTRQPDQSQAAAGTKLPVRLKFGTITEKGNPRFHPEARLTLFAGGQAAAPVPVSSHAVVPAALEKTGLSGTAVFLVISAPGFQDSARLPLPATSGETAEIPPIELIRGSNPADPAAPAPPQLPASLAVNKLLPPEVLVSDGTTDITLTGGQPLDLRAFKTASPDRPLSLTFSANGYQPASRTVQPLAGGAAAEALSVELDPVMARFSWKPDPPEWFSKARLVRQDPPADPRLEPVIELTGSSQSIPAGRYSYYAWWGPAALKLGDLTLTSQPQEAVFRFPLPTRLRWTGMTDLNPRAILEGNTAPLKTAAASWNLNGPVPYLLELQPGGAAVLYLPNPRIMQLSLLGLMAGSIPGRTIDNPAKVVEETMLRSYAAETAAGQSLGEWFRGFWQTQSDTNLSRSEEWRTSFFLQSQNEAAFLTGFLASQDPWAFLANPAYTAPREKFLDRIPLQLETLEPEGLLLKSQDQASVLRLSPDGQSAEFTAPGKGTVALPAR